MTEEETYYGQKQPPLNFSRFKSKRAMLFGAGNEIGRAIARRLVAEGASVACIDEESQSANIKATVQMAEQLGGTAMGLVIDLEDENAIHAAISRIVGDMGSPHSVITSLSEGRFQHSTTVSVYDWNLAIASNLTTPFLIYKAAIPHLFGTQGSIVSVLGLPGHKPQPFGAAYYASVNGLIGLVQALSLEFAERGVRLNIVSPGGLNQKIVTEYGIPYGADPKFLARLKSSLGNPDPDQIASLVAFLCSDEAIFVTGSIYHVDGGISV